MSALLIRRPFYLAHVYEYGGRGVLLGKSVSIERVRASRRLRLVANAVRFVAVGGLAAAALLAGLWLPGVVALLIAAFILYFFVGDCLTVVTAVPEVTGGGIRVARGEEIVTLFPADVGSIVPGSDDPFSPRVGRRKGPCRVAIISAAYYGLWGYVCVGESMEGFLRQAEQAGFRVVWEPRLFGSRRGSQGRR